MLKMGLKQGLWINMLAAKHIHFPENIKNEYNWNDKYPEFAPLKLVNFPADHMRGWWLHLMCIYLKDAVVSMFVHGRLCLWWKTWSHMVTFVLVIIHTDFIRTLQLRATSSTVAIQNLWMVPSPFAYQIEIWIICCISKTHTHFLFGSLL